MVRKQVKLKPHKCCHDAVPFDDNLISLESEFFASPETRYINASRIKFANCDQTFIAAQAPKATGFKHFWHMVIQEEVRGRDKKPVWCLLSR